LLHWSELSLNPDDLRRNYSGRPPLTFICLLHAHCHYKGFWTIPYSFIQLYQPLGRVALSTDLRTVLRRGYLARVWTHGRWSAVLRSFPFIFLCDVCDLSVMTLACWVSKSFVWNSTSSCPCQHITESLSVFHVVSTVWLRNICFQSSPVSHTGKGFRLTLVNCWYVATHHKEHYQHGAHADLGEGTVFSPAASMQTDMYT
jgi:hypothetical protein